jgi:hypothetical protein
MASLYDIDFAAWAEDQAGRLRRERDRGSNLDLDWDNLIDEVADLSRSQKRALAADLAVVVEHLAKLALSPADRPARGWRASVAEHRERALDELADSPSLAPLVPDLVERGWRQKRAVVEAALARDAYRRTVPEICPFTAKQVLSRGWYPERPALTRRPRGTRAGPP